MTKAEAIAHLAPRLQHAYCMPACAFGVEEWRSDGQRLLAELSARFGPRTLIVRSSAHDEDTRAASLAGAYLTVLGVDGADREALASAIERVARSYGRDDARDQVLVQEQLCGVRLAGVLATRDLGTGSAYFVFSYDDRTGQTDSATSGHGANLRTYVRFRGARAPYPSRDLQVVFEAATEVEALLDGPLEIELAVDAEGRVCIFQARPLPAVERAEVPVETLARCLQHAAEKVEELGRPHPHLQGTRSVFGVMPDWNPAEIVGLRPRALALSLYKDIVTDSVWAYMRDNYGYRNLRSFPLLVSMLGVPYIDVRVSFNSFVPKGVRESLSEKLINYYVDRLVEMPQAHDKVEFDIVFSCYYPGIRRDLARLEEHGFSGVEVGELVAALRDLTNQVVHPERGFYRADLAKIEHLKVRQRQILSSPRSTLDKVYWLLEDCKRYGTLPFSGLARAGFIAVQFLRAFVSLGILSQEDHDAFLRSLDTVTSRMKRDVHKLQRGQLKREEFLASYGHLRPGTYDILSPRYDEDFERYFGDVSQGVSDAGEEARAAFCLRPAQEHAITEILAGDGLALSTHDLFAFARAGIEGREYAKLVFSRSLSDALVELEMLGQRHGISREQLSHLDIRTVQRLYSTADPLDVTEVLGRDIEANRRAHDVTMAVRLPHLIVSSADVQHFHLGRIEPNFITLNKVTAEVMSEQSLDPRALAGKAVLLRSADPGYDWLFAKRIGALITQFGGANSHMAVRAAEQGIPAVIGCGEQKFQSWSSAIWLEIDCANRLNHRA